MDEHVGTVGILFEIQEHTVSTIIIMMIIIIVVCCLFFKKKNLFNSIVFISLKTNQRTQQR